MKTKMLNVKVLNRNEMKAVTGGVSSASSSFCNRPGERPCCEYFEDEFGNPTNRCRVWARCVGNQVICP